MAYTKTFISIIAFQSFDINKKPVLSFKAPLTLKTHSVQKIFYVMTNVEFANKVYSYLCHFKEHHGIKRKLTVEDMFHAIFYLNCYIKDTTFIKSIFNLPPSVLKNVLSKQNHFIYENEFNELDFLFKRI